MASRIGTSRIGTSRIGTSRIGRGSRAAGRGVLAIGRGIRAIGRGIRGAGRGLRRFGRWSWTHVHGRLPVGWPTWLIWIVAVAMAFIGFGTSALTYDVDRLGWGPMPFVGALVGLPFGLALTRPVWGWAVSVGSALVMWGLLPTRPGVPWPWEIPHALVMFGLLFAVCASRRFLAAAGAWLVTAALFAAGSLDGQRAGWVVGVTAVAVVGLLAGRLARTRLALARQTLVNEEERAERVRLQERARIARDLHDIVAHHMSLIVVQAETAPYRVPDLPESAQAELTSIGTAARAALAETRSLLSVLRQDGDEPAAREPQPGIEQIDELVASARRAGAQVATRVEPVGDRLRPGAALAAYRIVQEALSNAARHAPGAVVQVDVGERDGRVTVQVLNGPAPDAEPAETAGPAEPAEPGSAPSGRGHGIAGMQERAAAEGGTLTAEPTADGGFRVEAVLPAATTGATATAGTAGTAETAETIVEGSRDDPGSGR